MTSRKQYKTYAYGLKGGWRDGRDTTDIWMTPPGWLFVDNTSYDYPERQSENDRIDKLLKIYRNFEEFRLRWNTNDYHRLIEEGTWK